MFVVKADWAEGPYSITGQALALIEEGGPDGRTRDCIVEALRRRWDAGVDRPVVESELVESCSRALAPPGSARARGAPPSRRGREDGC